MPFWKSNICTDQLDLQEANVSVAQLHWIRNHIVGCWFADEWFTGARLVGVGYWSAGYESPNTKTNPSVRTGNRCRHPKHTQDSTSVGSERGSVKHGSSSFERTPLWERITVVRLRRHWSCDTNDHQRQKADEETCFPHPPSCPGLVIWQNQSGPKKSKSSVSNPKTNSQTF